MPNKKQIFISDFLMSAVRDTYQSYRQAQVETADQATLLPMLYSGALKFLGQACEAMEDSDVEETNRLLGRVQGVQANIKKVQR